MNIFEMILLAVGVAMDAFAVSICKGITIKENINKKATLVGSWFGLFQGLMPLIGYFLMDIVDHYLLGIKEYVIFGLLTYIGISMIVETFKKEEIDSSLGVKEMFILSIATSLDALSIGMTISLLKTNIFLVISIISIITFLFCFVGVKIGCKFGMKYKNNAEIAGGIILILIGIKVLLEYLM